jgi:hypothetical protein
VKLENEIMRMLLDGDDPVLEALRAQRQAAIVTSREYSGVGFFTSLNVPKKHILKEGLMDFELGDVYARLQGLEHEVGFVLFVRGGRLDFLEGYTHGDDDWPESPQLVEAYYLYDEPPPGPGNVRCAQRDMEQLRMKWYETKGTG